MMEANAVFISLSFCGLTFATHSTTALWLTFVASEIQRWSVLHVLPHPGIAQLSRLDFSECVQSSMAKA